MSYQKNNDRLLIRPRANLEESFQSYLIRLARDNGYKYSAFSSAITANSKPHRSMKLQDRKEIQALIQNIADPNASDLTDIWECANYHKEQFDFARTKFCSQCYQESNVLLPYWWLKNYLVCNKHKTLMIDSCTHCNTKINEDSLAQECCLNCNTPFELFKLKVVQPDPYSDEIAKIFLNFIGNTLNFVSLIDSEFSRRYVENSIGSFLLKELDNKTTPRHNRRNFSVEDLFSVQVDIQHVISSLGVKQLLYDFLMKVKNETGKGLPTALNPVFDLMMSSDGELYKIPLIQLLLSPPSTMSSWPLGVYWLEKLFTIPKDEFGTFIKENYPEYRNKSQGPLTIDIENIDFLKSQYLKKDEKC